MKISRLYRYAAHCYAAGRLPGYRVPAAIDYMFEHLDRY